MPSLPVTAVAVRYPLHDDNDTSVYTRVSQDAGRSIFGPGVEDAEKLKRQANCKREVHNDQDLSSHGKPPTASSCSTRSPSLRLRLLQAHQGPFMWPRLVGTQPGCLLQLGAGLWVLGAALCLYCMLEARNSHSSSRRNVPPAKMYVPCLQFANAAAKHHGRKVPSVPRRHNTGFPRDSQRARARSDYIDTFAPTHGRHSPTD